MYARYPGYLPLPTALTRAPGPVPNRNAIDNGAGNFLPTYLPPGSASFMPYEGDPNLYIFTSPDRPEVLYAGDQFDSGLSGLLRFSAFALSSAVSLQRLPPALATNAVRKLMEEKALLESHFSELSSSDQLRAKGRIEMLNDVIYLATSTDPAQLNAASAAKMISDYIYTRHSVQQLREKLNAHHSGFMTLRNPSDPVNGDVTIEMIGASASKVDAADLMLKAAKTKGAPRRVLQKLERTLLDADLAHVKLKLAFLEQSKRKVADVADKALSIVQSPDLTQEIQGLIATLPSTTIDSQDAARLSADIEAATRQELLRRLAENEKVSGKLNPMSLLRHNPEAKAPNKLFYAAAAASLIALACFWKYGEEG